jgi:hypothetical protein
MNGLISFLILRGFVTTPDILSQPFMTISYTLSRGEIVAVFWRSIILMPGFGLRMIGAAFIISVFAVIDLFRLSATDGPVRILISILLVMIVALLLFSVLPLLEGKTPRTLTIDSEGIWVDIGSTTTLTPWWNIGGIREMARYVFIKNGDSKPYVVPDRAFQGSQEREAFIAAIEGQLAKRRNR